MNIIIVHLFKKRYRKSNKTMRKAFIQPYNSSFKNAISDYTFISKYATYKKDLKRRETFEECISAVMNMHKNKFIKLYQNDVEFNYLLNTIEQAMIDRKILGSQRALQFKGVPIEKKNARIYNCTASYADRPKFFQELTWVLLCGCGAGFSVEKKHTSKIPKIVKPNGASELFVIPDTIEGWADAVGVLIESWLKYTDYADVIDNSPFQGKYSGKKIVFDYSLIRPEGAPISYGGKAPGPEPLRKCINHINELLEKFFKDNSKGEPIALNPIQIYDIAMFIADAAVSGGVRRSACICLFDRDDTEMIHAKTGNWFEKNPHRGRSNNSAVILRNTISYEDFKALFIPIKDSGEPGFVFFDQEGIVVNPCCEISMYPVDPQTGKTGWSFCNLTEINASIFKTKEDFIEAAKAASALGTLQASYTDFGYLGEVTERIVREEALLGVSMTGMMESPEISFNPEFQREAAIAVKEMNKWLAAKIGIKQAARCTCIKPAGSTSCIFGGVSSGIHAQHSKKFLRRIQTRKNENPVKFLKDYNPACVEESIWSTSRKDYVVTFCIQPNKNSITKKDINAIQFLEKIKTTQMNWVEYGTNEELCFLKTLRHNVSNTVTLRENDWDKVINYLYENQKYFTGVSFVPDGFDVDFNQAPFSEVLDEEELVEMYGAGVIMTSGLIVDGMSAFDNDLYKACDAVLGRNTSYITELENIILKSKALENEIRRIISLRQDWIRRANKFANNYFDGNTLEMTRCLKRCNNFKVWCDLNRSFIPLDYTLMIENEDNTEIQATIACSGGACELK